MSVLKLNHFTEFANNKCLYKKPLGWSERIEKIATDPVYESTRISLISNIFKWGVFLGDYSSHIKSNSYIGTSVINKISDYSNVLSFWTIPNSFVILINKIANIFKCKVFTKKNTDIVLKDYCDIISKTADSGSSIASIFSGTIFRSPLNFEMLLNPDLINITKKNFERSICSYISYGFKTISLISRIVGGGDNPKLMYIIDLFLLAAKVTIVVLMIINIPMHAAIPLTLASASLGWGLYKVWKKT